jgi:hypothetical protein
MSIERIERRAKIIQDQIKARQTVDQYKKGPSLGVEEGDEGYDQEEDDEEGANGHSTMTTWQISSKPEWLENNPGN